MRCFNSNLILKKLFLSSFRLIWNKFSINWLSILGISPVSCFIYWHLWFKKKDFCKTIISANLKSTEWNLDLLEISKKWTHKGQSWLLEESSLWECSSITLLCVLGKCLNRIKANSKQSNFIKIIPLFIFHHRKLLNIGSVLYNAIVAIFKTSVPAYPNNQSFLSVELKIKPKKNTQQAIGNKILFLTEN